MFSKHVVLVRSDLDGQLRLMPANEYTISDGQIVGYLNPEVFGVTELISLYNELRADEWFEVLPLQYSGNNYTEARAIAMKAYPGGWEPAVSFDGWVNTNGVRPFVAGGALVCHPVLWRGYRGALNCPSRKLTIIRR